MNTQSFDIANLTADASVFAAVASSDDLFGLLSRSFAVPVGFVGLAIGPESERSVVPSGGRVSAGDAAEVLLVRTGPVRLTFRAGGLPSDDAYLFDATAEMAVEASDRAADLAAFRSVVMGPARRATAATLHEYLTGEARSALAGIVRERTASALSQAIDPTELNAAFDEAMQASCFSAGLRRVGDVEASFSSQQYRRVQAEAEEGARRRDQLAIDQQLRAAAETARQHHLESVARTLGELSKMAGASPGVEVADLIRQFGEDQRGELFRSLAMCSPASRRCAAVVAVAGRQIVWLDPAAPQTPTRQQAIETTDGYALSVQAIDRTDGQVLLAVGGRREVVLLDAGSGHLVRRLTLPQDESGSDDGGVNAAVRLGETWLATHSRRGLFVWAGAGADEGEVVAIPGASRTSRYRAALADAEGRAWLAVDERVLCCFDDELTRGDLSGGANAAYTGSRSAVHAIAVDGDDVYAGTEDGQVLVWALGKGDRCQQLYSSGPRACRSVHVRSAMGIRRLGVADGSEAIKELTLGDTVVDRYLAGGDLLDKAWWCDDLVVGKSAYHNVLHGWDVGRPDAPRWSVNVAELCGGNVADACLVVG